MKILDLIQRLQKAHDAHGDIDVQVYTYGGEGLDIVMARVEEHWVDTRDGYEHGEIVFSIEVK